MKRVAVFFDVDGTISEFGIGIPESTRTAIRKLRENGHYAFICTGRSGAFLDDEELFSIGFDGMVAACGAQVKFGDDLLLDYRMQPEKIKRILEISGQYGMNPVLEGEEYLYFDRQKMVVEMKDPFMTFMERENPSHLSPILERLEDMNVKKYCLSLDDVELAKEGLEILAKEDTIMHISDTLKEIVPSQFSKASGMQLICDYLNISIKDTVAFGDSANDIPMLQAAGFGIAMGNASNAAKEAADHITAHIAEDGIYKGLSFLGLI